MGEPRALVIGHGSAGQRHARVLTDLGLEVAFVSRREIDSQQRHATIAKGVAAQRPDYAVVATETSHHEAALRDLAKAGFRGTVLVEKPLGTQDERILEIPFAALHVGYQLRFHPVVQHLRNELAERHVVAVQAYVGQHLSQWRPERDYRSSYSSDRDRGGGALRDLSHEIDLLLWLFGAWRRMAAVGGNYGALGIDSDEAFALVLELERASMATLQLNYLDRIGRRDIVVTSGEATWHADLTGHRLRGPNGDRSFEAEADAPTREMHQAALCGDRTTLCDAAGGLEVMSAVSGAERAAREGVWVGR